MNLRIFAQKLQYKIEEASRNYKLNKVSKLLKLNENNLSYIDETNQISKNTKKISFKEFWQFYVSGVEAPHYRIPYKGRLMTKLPCDMFIYPDIIYQTKPEVILEIGTQRGISAIYFSDLLKDIGGRVLTVDINSPGDKILSEFAENNISFINGNINDTKTIELILEFCNGKKCLIIDDGSHNQDDVYSAFKSLNHLIPNNGLYIIEDGMTNSIAIPGSKELQANVGINEILKDYRNYKLYRDYDIFVLSTVFKGIIQKIG